MEEWNEKNDNTNSPATTPRHANADATSQHNASASADTRLTNKQGTAVIKPNQPNQPSQSSQQPKTSKHRRERMHPRPRQLR
jgi:hypothetical protein